MKKLDLPPESVSPYLLGSDDDSHWRNPSCPKNPKNCY
jgi:hypothetical protein